MTWTAPGNAGKPDIESYDLQFRKGTSGDWSDGPQDVAGTTATITGLDADSSYEVQVSATNDEGTGDWSAAGSGSTNADATITAIDFSSDPGADGTYAIGDAIEATVTFSEAVTVDTASGTPRLALKVGEGTRKADFDSGSGTTDLVFKYTVVEDDEDTDGIELEEGAIEPNGGTIKAGTTDATLTYEAVTADSGHLVDGVRPTVVSAETSEDGESILVTLSESLSSANGDSFSLIGRPPGSIASASHMGSVATIRLLPQFTIQHGDTVGFEFLSQNAVRDAAGNGNARVDGLSITNNVPEPAVSIAGVAITSTPAAGGNYATGEAIEVTVTFSEAVTVDTTGGTPRLRIDLGAGDNNGRHAAYASGSGTAALVFGYTVAAADESGTAGIALRGDGTTQLDLDLDGGTIQGAGGVDAHLSRAWLSFDPDHRVNWARPMPVGAAISADGASIVLTFNEALSGTRTNSGFEVKVDGSDATLTGTPSVSGTTVTLTLQTAVTAGQTVTVSYEDATANDDNFAIEDLRENDADSFTDYPVTNTVPDSRLSALSLGTIALAPEFDPAVTSYTAAVGNSVASATVTATTSDMDATVAYLDGDDAALADADAATDGFQVTLAVGETTFKAKVTNGTATTIYTVTVTRVAATATVCTWTPAAGETVIWSGTVTVAQNPGEMGDAGWTEGIHGSLAADSPSFTYKGHSYEVAQIWEHNDMAFSVEFAQATSDHIDNIVNSDSRLTIHACSSELTLSSALTAGRNLMNWSSANIAWNVGDSIGVALTTSEPGAPALTATPGTGGVTLSWSPPTSEGSTAITGYQYRRSPDGGSNWSPDWTDIPASASLTSYDVTGLTPGTAYTFQLRAKNGSGAGLHSEQVQATAIDEAPPPVQSGDLTATEGTGKVRLAWTAASGARGYEYRRRDGAGAWGPWKPAADGPLGVLRTATTFDDYDVASLTTYTYEVRAAGAVAALGAASATLGPPIRVSFGERSYRVAEDAGWLRPRVEAVVPAGWSDYDRPFSVRLEVDRGSRGGGAVLGGRRPALRRASGVRRGRLRRERAGERDEGDRDPGRHQDRGRGDDASAAAAQRSARLLRVRERRGGDADDRGRRARGRGAVGVVSGGRDGDACVRSGPGELRGVGGERGIVGDRGGDAV